MGVEPLTNGDTDFTDEAGEFLAAIERKKRKGILSCGF